MRLIIVLLFALLLAGCGISVSPLNKEGITVDFKDNSSSMIARGVTYVARIQDIEIAPYRIDNPVCSFYVKIINNSQDLISFSPKSFQLIDENGRQVEALEPGSILTSISRDSTYLIPYPFVGYYYLQDRVQEGFVNSFETSLPYYSENRPQNILLEALPAENIKQGNSVSGLVYFNFDLYKANRVDLRIRQPNNSGSDILLPFEIKR